MHNILNGHSEEIGVAGSASSKCGCWVVLMFAIFMIIIIIIISTSPLNWV